MVLGNVLAQHEADPGSVGLGRVERHEQVAAIDQARGPRRRPLPRRSLPSTRQWASNATAGLQRRIDGVRHQVDEGLVELIPVRLDSCTGSPSCTVDARGGSRSLRHAVHPRSHIDFGERLGGGSRASCAYAARNRRSDSARVATIAKTVLRIGGPIGRARLPNDFPDARRDRLDRCQRVVDLVTQARAPAAAMPGALRRAGRVRGRSSQPASGGSPCCRITLRRTCQWPGPAGSCRVMV